ncbi:hypothetical protein PO909_000052 [Leuciscus waleckii]
MEREKFGGGMGGEEGAESRWSEDMWMKGGRGVEERSGKDVLEKGGVEERRWEEGIGMRGVEEGKRWEEGIGMKGVEEERRWEEDRWTKGGRGVEEDGQAVGEGVNRRGKGGGEGGMSLRKYKERKYKCKEIIGSPGIEWKEAWQVAVKWTGGVGGSGRASGSPKKGRCGG